MFKFSKKLLGIIILSVLLISMVTATAHAVNTPKSIDNQDTGIVKIESKEKITKYKITWNGNGGKIGSKKILSTTVKKGSKIGKLAATPKRNGFSFKGWYTKKSGGRKIIKNTKITKKVILFAQWNKKKVSRVLTAEEKKLIGSWKRTHWYSFPTRSRIDYYFFYNNGSFSYISGGSIATTGNYKVSRGKIAFTNIVLIENSDKKENYPNTVADYRFEKDTQGKYVLIIPLFLQPSKPKYLSFDVFGSGRWTKY